MELFISPLYLFDGILTLMGFTRVISPQQKWKYVTLLITGLVFFYKHLAQVILKQINYRAVFKLTLVGWRKKGGAPFMEIGS